jgi:hypothetical protein
LAKLRERLSQVKRKKSFDGVQGFLPYTKLRDLENLPVKRVGRRLKKVITPESRVTALPFVAATFFLV